MVGVAKCRLILRSDSTGGNESRCHLTESGTCFGMIGTGSTCAVRRKRRRFSKRNELGHVPSVVSVATVPVERAGLRTAFIDDRASCPARDQESSTVAPDCADSAPYTGEIDKCYWWRLATLKPKQADLPEQFRP